MVSLIVIVEMLIGYNTVLAARAKDEEIAKLKSEIADEQRSEITETQTKAKDSDTEYKNGTYEGEAEGFGGPIRVKVKIEAGQISEIEILSAEKEDSAYLSMAEDIIPEIIEAQNIEVDTVSGATFSSTGIKNATQQALEKAVK